ncbi:histidine kinase [Streptomyces tanashiensis]
MTVVNAAAPGAGAGQSGGQAADMGGRGLTGLRERVTVLGGTLRTGPHRGGFRVTAVLPHRPPAQATPPGTDTAVGSAQEATERHAAVRRSARRRSIAAFAAPVVAAAFFVPAAVYLAWQLTTGVLTPARFDELEPGRSRTELTHLLPGGAFPYPPDHARSASRPPGAACEFYRSGRDLFDQVDLYRLCWTDGRLVAKDTWEATDSGRTSG